MPPASRAERATLWWLFAFGLVLPLEGVGTFSPRDWIGMQLCDLVVVAWSPLLLTVVWRARGEVLRDPILRACMGLAVAAIGADLLRDGATEGLVRSAAEHGVFVLTVASLAAAGALARSFQATAAIAFGGFGAVVLSLGGYAWAMIGDQGLDAPFVLRAAHPVFSGVPRLAGTFGHSPQEMGELCVVVLAAQLAAGRQANRGSLLLWLAIGATGLALLVTFSSAWLGGIALVAGLAAARKPSPARRLIAFVLVALFATMVSLAMNFGPPVDEATWRRSHASACGTRETEHYVTWSLDGRGDSCRQVPMSWPYRGILTTYWYAKKTAWAAISQEPWLGQGRHGFRAFAGDAFRRLSGGRTLGVYYERPHCTPLEVLSAFGLAGAIALALLLVAVIPRGPFDAASAALPVWLATVGFLLVGLNIDILERRPFWALLGLLAATSRRSSTRLEHLPEVLDRPPNAVVERDPRLPTE